MLTIGGCQYFTGDSSEVLVAASTNCRGLTPGMLGVGDKSP